MIKVQDYSKLRKWNKIQLWISFWWQHLHNISPLIPTRSTIWRQKDIQKHKALRKTRIYSRQCTFPKRLPGHGIKIDVGMETLKRQRNKDYQTCLAICRKPLLAQAESLGILDYFCVYRLFSFAFIKIDCKAEMWQDSRVDWTEVGLDCYYGLFWFYLKLP